MEWTRKSHQEILVHSQSATTDLQTTEVLPTERHADARPALDVKTTDVTYTEGSSRDR